MQVIQIVDVSPNAANTDASDLNRSVNGRMLAIACAPDGQAVYGGSYSNLWVSGDGGRQFDQLVWPQPSADEFDAPGSLGGWAVVDVAIARGWWRGDEHPRFLARLRRRGPKDIVGFGECGVWTALGNGDGTFHEPVVVLADFGYEAGGWRVDSHPRFVVDLTGDGRADIIGFGNAGIWTALGNGDGTFKQPVLALDDFGYDQGWRVNRHPRFVVDLTGDGLPDIIGFGDAGIWTALSNGDGTFQQPVFGLNNFAYHAGNWRVDKHPRFATDLTGDGRVDVLGFGDAGVWTALGNGDGTFQEARFVLPSFGYGETVLALTSADRAGGSRGIWRSTDGGGSWSQVHTFPFGGMPGQIVWAHESDHLVYAAGGTSLAISKDGGMTFRDAFPWGMGAAKLVNHVALWQEEAADTAPG